MSDESSSESAQSTHIVFLVTGIFVVGLFAFMAVVMHARRSSDDDAVAAGSPSAGASSNARFSIRNRSQRDFLIRQSLGALKVNSAKRLDTLPGAPLTKSSPHLPNIPKPTVVRPSSTLAEEANNANANGSARNAKPQDLFGSSFVDVSGTITEIHTTGELSEGTLKTENGASIHFVTMPLRTTELQSDSAARFVGVLIPDYDISQTNKGEAPAPLLVGAFDLPTTTADTSESQ